MELPEKYRECPMCSSVHAIYMGRLSSLHWLRCQNCGYERAVSTESWTGPVGLDEEESE